MDMHTAPTPRRPARTEPSGLIAWLKVLDAALRLVEKSVWEIRQAAEETVTWAREDWTRLLTELGAFRERASSEQERFLNDLGCDEGQGYLYSKPLPARELTQLLLTQGRQRIAIP